MYGETIHQLNRYTYTVSIIKCGETIDTDTDSNTTDSTKWWIRNENDKKKENGYKKEAS
jgi:hypothetical protein